MPKRNVGDPFRGGLFRTIRRETARCRRYSSIGNPLFRTGKRLHSLSAAANGGFPSVAVPVLFDYGQGQEERREETPSPFLDNTRLLSIVLHSKQ